LAGDLSTAVEPYRTGERPVLRRATPDVPRGSTDIGVLRSVTIKHPADDLRRVRRDRKTTTTHRIRSLSKPHSAYLSSVVVPQSDPRRSARLRRRAIVCSTRLRRYPITLRTQYLSRARRTTVVNYDNLYGPPPSRCTCTVNLSSRSRYRPRNELIRAADKSRNRISAFARMQVHP
jgi:hypothetical protein